MRLIWIRHGETLWNREFRLQGISDVELSDLGLRQARCLAAGLREKPQHLFTSPLVRTRSFAAPLAKRHKLVPEVLQDLREMSFGRWEGLRYEDMDEEMRRLFEQWCVDPVNTCPPGGEAASGLAGRVTAALENVRAQVPADSTVVLVTHGGVIRVAVTMLMGMVPETAARLHIDPGSVTVTDFVAGTWRLQRLNDTCHLYNEDC